MNDAVSINFFDSRMKISTSVYLKQTLMPLFRNVFSTTDIPYYSSCLISPRLLPDKPYTRRGKFKKWIRAKRFLLHLNALEVQWYPISRKEVKRFMFRCLVRVGVSKHNSKLLLDTILDTETEFELGGGLLRLELYVADILDGSCDAGGVPEVMRSGTSTAWVDGKNAPGPVIGKFCMKLAIKLARAHGVGFVVTKNSGHIGKSAWYSEMAIKKGMLGMVYASTPRIQCPTRARKSALGWNSIGFAAPGANSKSNLQFELKTTATSLRTIITCFGRGRELPPNSGLNEFGESTTDPAEVLERGCVHPLGGTEESSGYKGYGLAIMVETLCGILGDAKYGRNIKHIYERLGEPANIGQCYIAVNPKKFAKGFKSCMSDMLKDIPEASPADEFMPVSIPRETFPERKSRDLRFRLVELMAAYQLSCLLDVPPLEIRY